MTYSKDKIVAVMIRCLVLLFCLAFWYAVAMFIKPYFD